MAGSMIRVLDWIHASEISEILETTSEILETTSEILETTSETLEKTNDLESPLLHLPGELRNRVYDHLFSNCVLYFEYHVRLSSADRSPFYDKSDTARKQRQEKNKSNLTLASTCRKLRKETEMLPYKLGHIVCIDIVFPFIKRMKRFCPLHLVTRMTIELWSRGEACFLRGPENILVWWESIVEDSAALKFAVEILLQDYPALTELTLVSNLDDIPFLEPQRIKVGRTLVVTKRRITL